MISLRKEIKPSEPLELIEMFDVLDILGLTVDIAADVDNPLRFEAQKLVQELLATALSWGIDYDRSLLCWES
jgi:hypothetical protein